MSDFPTEDLFVAAAWTSPINRRYTIMRCLPGDHSGLEPLAQRRGNQWEPTQLGQKVDALLRESVQLRPGILGSKSGIFFTEDSVQISPYTSRDETSRAGTAQLDDMVAAVLSEVHRLPERLFGFSHRLRFVFLSDTPVLANVY